MACTLQADLYLAITFFSLVRFQLLLRSLLLLNSKTLAQTMQLSLPGVKSFHDFQVAMLFNNWAEFAIIAERLSLFYKQVRACWWCCLASQLAMD